MPERTQPSNERKFGTEAAINAEASIALREIFDAAVAAAHPAGKFAGRLPRPPASGRTIVLGAGKAAASMAVSFEEAWGRPCEGLVITRYGHGAPTRHVEVVEAAHPVPDAAGLAAAQRIADLARNAGPDDLVVCLISGGASALMVMPIEGVSIDEKRQVNRALLRSGAPISAMNQVRTALSAIKGGGLAAMAAPARVVTFVISDVPGDDPAVVGSGPTIPSPFDPDLVLAICDRYNIALPGDLPAAIRRRQKPLVCQAGEVHLLVTPKSALVSAAARAAKLGYRPLVLGDAIEGEARELGVVMAGIARSVRQNALPIAAPCALISGGETTVTMSGSGRGGRNTEFLLSLAVALGAQAQTWALACDTDGIDGSEDNAGAWIDPGFLHSLTAAGGDARASLETHDAYGAFKRTGRLIVTGPTLTNVNDFRLVLIQ